MLFAAKSAALLDRHAPQLIRGLRRDDAQGVDVDAIGRCADRTPDRLRRDDPSGIAPHRDRIGRAILRHRHRW
ncbi:hypothetical protein OVN18_03610 [Microcella daejeonensis]|uniref:Uncharacterized protein n=1 Tax=Microcella daejeonensis TaxID=2994971 RepID=A0A9E8MME4_9MICO|nr:hypothetical protein [Microcella daejeonensis]WAB82109.1 hypothetical protein OVN18_03610 [Microcella daejeonensis]